MEDLDPNIARTYRQEVLRLRVILGAISLLLGVGLVAPIITLQKFVLVENTFSVLGGVIELLKDGQIFLFIVITAFSIVLPVLKVGVLYRLLGVNRKSAVHLEKYLQWMHVYGKWSMLDVFVVAVMVVAVKLGVVARAEMRFGLYLFAAAVLLTMYVTARVVRLTNASRGQAPGSHLPS